MSRRDPERGERAARGHQPASSIRANEYFVPKEGIDREVITADICRYLGNNALVRPGTYENPQTRQAQSGYFITAYRNLTTAMIADLKADSERWEAERRQTASRGQPSNVAYSSSQVHQSRQRWGPSGEPTPGLQAGYAQAQAASAQQGVYDNGYQSPQAYPAQGYPSQDNYYAGAAMEVDRGPTRGQTSQQAGIQRTANSQYSSSTPQYPSSTPQYPSTGSQYASSAAQYQTQADGRGNYYQQSPTPTQPDGRSSYPTVSSGQGTYQQPADPLYGRAGYDDYNTEYDTHTRAYPEAAVYTQAPPISSTPSTAAPSAPSRRDRDRGEDRESRHGHGRRR